MSRPRSNQKMPRPTAMTGETSCLQWFAGHRCNRDGFFRHPVGSLYFQSAWKNLPGCTCGQQTIAGKDVAVFDLGRFQEPWNASWRQSSMRRWWSSFFDFFASSQWWKPASIWTLPQCFWPMNCCFRHWSWSCRAKCWNNQPRSNKLKMTVSRTSFQQCTSSILSLSTMVHRPWSRIGILVEGENACPKEDEEMVLIYSMQEGLECERSERMSFANSSAKDKETIILNWKDGILNSLAIESQTRWTVSEDISTDVCLVWICNLKWKRCHKPSSRAHWLEKNCPQNSYLLIFPYATTIHSPAPPETHTGKRPNPLHLLWKPQLFCTVVVEVEDKLHDDIFETRNGIHWWRGRRWWKLGFYAGVDE